MRKHIQIINLYAILPPHPQKTDVGCSNSLLDGHCNAGHKYVLPNQQKWLGRQRIQYGESWNKLHRSSSGY
ncbi:MAG: hypothetical protein OXQ96_04120 [Alphaproteobacteria bacterium]|nr:hypothetical protein [Alphaproteobacteria bacterium]